MLGTYGEGEKLPKEGHRGARARLQQASAMQQGARAVSRTQLVGRAVCHELAHYFGRKDRR